MANVEIKANTADAQRKIKQLRQDIDKLDKQVKTPKKYNLQTRGIGGSLAGSAGLGGRAMGMAVAGGSMIGGLAATAFSKLVNVLSAAIPALLKFGLGIDNVNGLMKKWSGALEAYSNAPEIALQRGDSMDALDDERRAHGTKTLAEEYGWSEAFRNVGGNEFSNQILTRIETLVEQAKGGNIEAIEALQKLDTYKGLTAVGDRGEMQKEYAIGSHLNEMNTYQVLAEVMRGYHAAKEEGDYTKIDALTKLIGRRGIGIANKLGDVSEVERQAELLAAKWNETHTNESEILNAAAKSEIMRSEGKVYDFGVPTGGEKNIITGAKNEVEASKLAYDALSANNSEVIDKASDAIKNDFNNLSEQVKNSPIGKAIQDSIIEPMQHYGTVLGETVESLGSMNEKLEHIINTNVWDKLVGEHIDKALEWAVPSPDATEQLISEMPRPSEGQIRAFGDNAYKPLVESHPNYETQKLLEEARRSENPDNPVIQEMLDPATFNRRFWESLNPPKTQEATQQKAEEVKQSQAVVTALNEVANNLKTTTAATTHMTATMQKGIVLNNANGSTIATFA